MHLACVFVISQGSFPFSVEQHTPRAQGAVCPQSAEQRGFYQQKLLLENRQITLTYPESRYPVDPPCIFKRKKHSWEK